MNLHARGLPPWVEGVDDMANRIIATRGTRRAEKLWSHCFINGERSSIRVLLVPTTSRGPSAEIPTSSPRGSGTRHPLAPYCGCGPWVSQAPHNPSEALSQNMLVQTRVINYYGSSRKAISTAVEQMAKMHAHSVTLLTADNHDLRRLWLHREYIRSSERLLRRSSY